MTASLCKLSHVALVTPDIDRSLWFYRDIIGMDEVESDGTRIYLRCPGELQHHSVTLREGPTGVEHMAFRVGGPDDLATYAVQLRAEGLDVEEVARGDEAGQGDALRFTTPYSELPFELVWDLDKPLAPEGVRGKLPNASGRFGRGAPRRIDHVNCQTSIENVAPAEQFLIEQFGFKRREYVQPTEGPVMLTFLSVTPQVHDIALGPDGQNRTGRFHHFALDHESFSDLWRAADLARENEIQVDVWPARHGVGQSFCFYLRDPGSGHRVELYSGGYVIYDPDWEPVRWTEHMLDYGVIFSGAPFTIGGGGPMDENTPTAEPAAVAS
jgi:catechol 2,3-dioxygenase-like lactoylglutathione lyase family enzyme